MQNRCIMMLRFQVSTLYNGNTLFNPFHLEMVDECFILLHYNVVLSRYKNNNYNSIITSLQTQNEWLIPWLNQVVFIHNDLLSSVLNRFKTVSYLPVIELYMCTSSWKDWYHTYSKDYFMCIIIYYLKCIEQCYQSFISGLRSYKYIIKHSYNNIRICYKPWIKCL